jgi:hypothetical protein
MAVSALMIISSIRPLDQVTRPTYSIIARTTSAITFLITFFRLLDRVAGPLYSIIAGTKSTRVVLIVLAVPIVAFFSALEAGNLGPANLVVFLPSGSRVRLGEGSPPIVIAIIIAIVVAIIIAIAVLPP